MVEKPSDECPSPERVKKISLLSSTEKKSQ